jgi:hypothetical protein
MFISETRVLSCSLTPEKVFEIDRYKVTYAEPDGHRRKDDQTAPTRKALQSGSLPTGSSTLLKDADALGILEGGRASARDRSHIRDHSPSSGAWRITATHIQAATAFILFPMPTQDTASHRARYRGPRGRRAVDGGRDKRHRRICALEGVQARGALGDSPGERKDGLHIECSAMSKKYSGRHFDIHMRRRIDVPHHGTRRRSPMGTRGHPFVNYWMHNG